LRLGLVNNFTESQEDQLLAIERAVPILSDPHYKEKYKTKREKLLAECIDTTRFMVTEVLKYQTTGAHAPTKKKVRVLMTKGDEQ